MFSAHGRSHRFKSCIAHYPYYQLPGIDMKYVIYYVCFLICILITIPLLSGQNERFLSDNITRNLEFGPYHIGYKIEHIYDSNRRFTPKQNSKKLITTGEALLNIGIWFLDLL